MTKGHVSDVAGTEVEGACLTGSAEDAHARLALDVMLPLIGVGVLMQLSHSAGVDLDQRRSDHGGHRECAGMADPHRSAALGLDRLLRHEPMAKALRHGGYA